MSRTWGSAGWTPPSPTAKSEPPKLRRKLQKLPKDQRNSFTSSKSESLGISYESLEPHPQPQPNAGSFKPAHRTSLSSPPDLQSSRWSGYFRSNKTSQPPHGSATRSRHTAHKSLDVIPELAHLQLHDATSSQGSLDTPGLLSPASSSTTNVRRKPKTPILAIGQLEGFLNDTAQPSKVIERVSSIELIAAQYRALLESRQSMYSDAHETLMSPLEEWHDTVEVRPMNFDLLGSDSNLTNSSAAYSPTSDDGTLVAFEDERSYQEPESFLAPDLQPAASPHKDHFAFEEIVYGSPSPAPDNLSLQICMDLLSRDLSAVAGGQRRFRSNTEISALQIWVMIEAYERLSDQLLDSSALQPQARQMMRDMFDMWLRALYAVHSTMNRTGSAFTSVSESDYGELVSHTPALD